MEYALSGFSNSTFRDADRAVSGAKPHDSMRKTL